MAGKQESRAGSLLPEVLPDILTLLDDAPAFGQCGLDIVFHNGCITRVISRKEETRQACKKANQIEVQK